MTFKELLHKLKIMEENEPEQLENIVMVLDDKSDQFYLIDDLYAVFDEDNEVEQVPSLLFDVKCPIHPQIIQNKWRSEDGQG